MSVTHRICKISMSMVAYFKAKYKMEPANTIFTTCFAFHQYIPVLVLLFHQICTFLFT